MEPRTLKFIAEKCGGELLAGNPELTVTRICTDSRKVQAGDLFFALQGERFDGHDFLPQIFAAKPAAVVVANSRKVSPEGACAVIAVGNPRQALCSLGGAYRMQFSLPVIAVGGSNGKTTTKELLASILRQCRQTLWSEASFNNDIGVPLTLLNLGTRHEAAVLEVGTNHPGELAPLVRCIQPKFGIVTSIGREHLEFFGDIEGVLDEEGWLAELLPADGALFLHGDSEWAPSLARRSPARLVRVGFGADNNWRIKSVKLQENGTRFEVESPSAEFSGSYEIQLLGRHHVINAALALACSAEFGISASAARGGLAQCRSPKMRLHLSETGGVRILDDAYNANADSVLAALQTLNELPCAGRRIAVLGDMAELGDHTEAAHTEVGRRTAELRIGQLVTVGKWAQTTADAARSGGLESVLSFPDVESGAAAIPGLVKPGDLVLLKASRAAGLERIGESLQRALRA